MKNGITHFIIEAFKIFLIAVLLMGSIWQESGTASIVVPFDSGKCNFSIKYKNEINPYSISAVFVLPQEKIQFEVQTNNSLNEFSFEPQAGGIIDKTSVSWTWQAPQKSGVYPITITELNSKQIMTLNVFVLVPYNKMSKGFLNGYRIGQYPPPTKIKSVFYKPPEGFVEVTPSNRDIKVSPHFTLGQFICKQTHSYPKYIVLRERLIDELENVLTRVNEYGLRCQTLTVMSGYRTPYYNKIIKNTPYSRHLWGDAADVYIDFDPVNGVMDDLDKNGKVDFKDGLILKQIVQNLQDDPIYQRFTGGLGVYRPTKQRGPFVHMDVRGVPASW